MSDSLDEPFQNNFPIAVSDGVDLHFLDGFISFLFYTTRTIPRKDKDEVEIINKKEMIADIRLSINKAKKLSTDLKNGFTMSPLMNVLEGKTDFFTGVDEETVEVRKYSETIKIDENEWNMARIAKGILYEIIDLPKEENKKCMDIIYQAVCDKSTQLREIMNNIKVDQKQIKHESE